MLMLMKPSQQLRSTANESTARSCCPSCMKSPTSESYRTGSELGISDIICSRDSSSNKHPGNQQYHRLVLKYRDLYQASYISEYKADLTNRVIQIVEDYGGLFVKFDANANAWVEISDYAKREKVSHALRSSYKLNMGNRKRSNRKDDASPKDAKKSKHATSAYNNTSFCMGTPLTALSSAESDCCSQSWSSESDWSEESLGSVSSQPACHASMGNPHFQYVNASTSGPCHFSSERVLHLEPLDLIWHDASLHLTEELADLLDEWANF